MTWMRPSGCSVIARRKGGSARSSSAAALSLPRARARVRAMAAVSFWTGSVMVRLVQRRIVTRAAWWGACTVRRTASLGSKVQLVGVDGLHPRGGDCCEDGVSGDPKGDRCVPSSSCASSANGSHDWRVVAQGGGVSREGFAVDRYVKVRQDCRWRRGEEVVDRRANGCRAVIRCRSGESSVRRGWDRRKVVEERVPASLLARVEPGVGCAIRVNICGAVAAWRVEVHVPADEAERAVVVELVKVLASKGVDPGYLTSRELLVVDLAERQPCGVRKRKEDCMCSTGYDNHLSRHGCGEDRVGDEDADSSEGRVSR